MTTGLYLYLFTWYINNPINLIKNQDVSWCFGRRPLHRTDLSCPTVFVLQWVFFFSSLLTSKECHGITSQSLLIWFIIHLPWNRTVAKGIVCFLIYKWPPLGRIAVILDVLPLHYQLNPEITQLTRQWEF